MRTLRGFRTLKKQNQQHFNVLADRQFSQSYEFLLGPVGFRAMDWKHNPRERKTVIDQISLFCLSFALLSPKERAWYGSDIARKVSEMALFVASMGPQINDDDIESFVVGTLFGEIGWHGI